MKYIFRNQVIFEYIPENKNVIQYKVNEIIPAFDFCKMIPEDYKLLSEFFQTVYDHINDNRLVLKDIEVN